MKKQARTIIKVTLSFLTFALLISCSKSINEKPNIIIVMTDDQGYGDLGFNGNEIIKTPNLNQFASESINFTINLTDNIKNDRLLKYMVLLVQNQSCYLCFGRNCTCNA